MSATPVDAAGNLRWLPAALTDPGFWGNNAVLFGLAAVVLVFTILTPDFLTSANISDLLVAAAILVALAIGQSFVVALGGIDLSIGSTLPLTAVLLGWAHGKGIDLPLAILLAIAGGGVAGLINGLVIAKGRINDFIVTLGTLSIFSGVGLVISEGQSVAVNSTFLQDLAISSFGPIRWMVLVAIVIALLAHVLIFHTRFGTHILATGGKTEAARSMGVRVDRIRIAAYVASGLLAGLAGVLLVARTGGSDPSLQSDLLLSSIAAVVLGGASLNGGRASIVGAVAGALLLSALLNGFTLLQVSGFYQPIAVGIVVVAAAVLSRFQR
ncbi:MAG: ribose transport system permease protein [Gaiellaceae bacterium]|nr:ribose transport system permease protein [Gaiellaceae bacterium]